MSLHRFYLPPERWEESSPELDPADAHHATDVLRLGVGDTITLFDGQGRVKKEKEKEKRVEKGSVLHMDIFHGGRRAFSFLRWNTLALPQPLFSFLFQS